jgi:hypothetical protein
MKKREADVVYAPDIHADERSWQWLIDAVMDYLRTHAGERPNTQAVLDHFKLRRIDGPLAVLQYLEETGKITKVDHWAAGFSGHHHYEVLTTD